MNLFSEIYNCYYQVMKNILESPSALTLDQLRANITEKGYEESLLYLIPKLTSGEWDLLEQNGEVFLSKLTGEFYVPLTKLQQAYIKTILQDERIQLFLNPEELEKLNCLFADSPVLWKKDDFYYYDRFSDQDNFADPDYQKHFRTLVTAISKKQYTDISYESRRNHRVHHHYLPCRLEYSIKNNKFRLIAVEHSKRSGDHVEILNLERIKEVSLLPKKIEELPDINKMIRDSYYKEPVRLLIHNRRNALERTMLQFANYEKNTTKVDTDTYECLIYYNQRMETELLIEVLSFGPMIQVLGNERFLGQLKARLRTQKRLFHP
ncbi:MAG: WYL domain-containing protein [Lachnospiraceae bacterium]|nr:WYL domain-containing protein [Lachnospiraceae bacterium]